MWNKWAEDMLVRKEALKKTGKWKVEQRLDDLDRYRTMSADPSVPEIQAWLDEAYVDFSNLIFQTEQSSDLQDVGEESVEENSAIVKSIPVTGNYIDFSGYIFPSEAYFSSAKFQGGADFRSAKFQGGADFRSAKFQGEAYFISAKFQGWADFGLVDFERHANFSNAKFNKQANFEAILVKRAFSLADAEFTTDIANFTQANFAESPRLDNVKVLPAPELKKSPLGWQRYFWTKNYLPYLKRLSTRYLFQYPKHVWNEFFNTRRNPDEEAHYRALKRLAIQAHDHENEMKFFAGEIRARRHVTDFANFLIHDFASSMRYWAGVAYELFSDFGRSFIRPALWWFACLWLFANLTLSGAGLMDKTKCHNSQLTPKEAAYTIGLKNSLLILGLTKTNIVKQAELCLYGVNKNGEVDKETKPYDPKIKRAYQAKPTKADTTKTDIPFKAAVQGITHSLLSLLFIFLLLLAIRNQFKIK